MKVIAVKDGLSIPFFTGVTGKIVLSSEKLMFFLVEIGVGQIVPEHSHPHEQMGLWLEGKAMFSSGGHHWLVEKGMAYFIESHEKHSVEVIGDQKGVFLDVFCPPREDYLEKIGSPTQPIP